MNREQSNVFNTIISGRTSVAILGSAGTGKSYTIKKIVEWAKKNCKNIGITSSTGTSAITIGGRTIHSFLGIGLAKKDAYHLYLHTKSKYPGTIEKLKTLEMLVIDEISMVSDVLFDKISEYLCIIRKNKEPFGGVQLVLCGDMCQLPPVQGEYCFKSNAWKHLNIKCVELLVQVRQDGDKVFQQILNDARFGKCTDESFEQLKKLKNPNFGEIKPTVLYSKNINVDEINIRKYKQLVDNGNQTRSYTSNLSDHKYTKTWAESLGILEETQYCIGAQVMLTVNLSVEEGFANGSRGMITEFTDEGPVVLFKNGEQIVVEYWLYQDDNDDNIWVSAIPLKLAYALTIHKSQSMTLDAAIVDLGPSIFEYGQAYVALSRVRDMKSVKIINILKSSFQTHEDVIDFYKKLKTDGSS
jgi:ATP-dependent exoDNAse (exonuclease V) alpha subunit